MEPTDHFVYVPMSLWSHLRMTLQFSINLLQLHPSLINTFMVNSITLPRLKRELSLQPASLMKQLEGRRRIVEVKDDLRPGTNAVEERQVFTENFPEALRRVLRGEAEGRFRTVPCAFICDVAVSTR